MPSRLSRQCGQQRGILHLTVTHAGHRAPGTESPPSNFWKSSVRFSSSFSRTRLKGEKGPNRFATVLSKQTLTQQALAKTLGLDPGYGDELRSEIPTAASESPLRPRFCHGPGCSALFFVCSRCDRGQRYCSRECRTAARRQQRRAASSRYQRTEAGKHAHRLRQRSYRQRHCRPRVTDQGSQSVTTAAIIRLSEPPRCCVCGRQRHWIDPFSPLGSRRRPRPRTRPPANVQNSTFSDDR